MKSLKNNVLMVLFLGSILSNIGLLDAAEKKTVNWWDKFEDVVFGDAPMSSLFSSQSQEPETYEMVSMSELPKMVPFSALPQDVQNIIIGYITQVIDSSDPIISARAINALAQVNTALNQKINSPEFTQKLIANFYEKFAGKTYVMPYTFEYSYLIIKQGSQMDIPKNNTNVGYMSVAILLGTQGARQWLANHKPFMLRVEEANERYSEENQGMYPYI